MRPNQVIRFGKNMTDNKIIEFVKSKHAQLILNKEAEQREEIFVSKPFMPPLEKYQSYVKDIWERQWVTNNGTNVQDFEMEFSVRSGTYPLVYVANGTLALQLSIAALDLTGEVITSPFSFVATVSSIVWQGCKPVFADIDPETFNINAELIEEKISEKTSAILVPHVFGNPCDIFKIQQIADKYGLKVIYDAAHCFGTEFKSSSVLNYGDVSAISFHATKLFHTTEGGGVFTGNCDLREKLKKIRNFGYWGENNFDHVGINAKNSELHAAMGLCNLFYVDEILERRKELFMAYNEQLEGTAHRQQKLNPDCKYNHSYYPLVFDSEKTLLKVKDLLLKNRIHGRRYFYPSLNKLPYIQEEGLDESVSLSSRILCLPLYHDLSVKQVKKISSLIRRALR